MALTENDCQIWELILKKIFYNVLFTSVQIKLSKLDEQMCANILNIWFFKFLISRNHLQEL